MGLANNGLVAFLMFDPFLLIPGKPGVALLVEDMQGLIAELGELGAPAGAAFNGFVFQDLADDKDLLAVIDLIPDALQEFTQRRTVGITAVHQPRDIFEADVTILQLFVVENADAAPAHHLMSVKGKIDFFNTDPLGVGAELRLRALGAAAEEYTVFFIHSFVPFKSSSGKQKVY